MLIACALMFLIIAAVDDKRTGYTLALVAALLFVNAHAFSAESNALYFFRSCIVFFSATFLLNKLSRQSIYQSVILFCTLISYTLHETESALNTTLIYDHFEAVIYGLIACHFIGFFKTLWSCFVHVCSSCITGRKNIQRV